MSTYIIFCLCLLTSRIFVIFCNDFRPSFIDLFISSSNILTFMFIASWNFLNFSDLYLYPSPSTTRLVTYLGHQYFSKTAPPLSVWRVKVLLWPQSLYFIPQSHLLWTDSPLEPLVNFSMSPCLYFTPVSQQSMGSCVALPNLDLIQQENSLSFCPTTTYIYSNITHHNIFLGAVMKIFLHLKISSVFPRIQFRILS